MVQTRYIVFEGIDGSGKSSQIVRVYNWLRRLNYTPIQLNEPTYGKHGRLSRQLLSRGKPFNQQDQIEIFTKDRKEHIQYKIQPLLNLIKSTEPNCGFVLIQDRSYYSIAAYQSVDEAAIGQAIRDQELFAPRPNLVLFIDVPIDLALARIKQRGSIIDIFETPEALEKVRDNYHFVAKHQKNFILIDGVGTEEEVFERILDVLKFDTFDPSINY